MFSAYSQIYGKSLEKSLCHQSLKTWKGNSIKMNERACAVSSILCVLVHTIMNYKYIFETKHFKKAISFLSADCTVYCLRDMLSEDYFLVVFVVVAKRPQRMKRCFWMIGKIFCKGITSSLTIYCSSVSLCIRFYSPSQEVALESIFRDIKCTYDSFTLHKWSREENRVFGGSLSQLYDGDLNLNLEILTSISVDFELSPKKTLVSLVS